MHKKLDILAALESQLKDQGLKVTEPRKAILKLLIENHGPFTAEAIHKSIKRGLCDLATVHRSLKSLEDAKILRRCEFGDGSARYELAEAGNHHHHHIVCMSCKRIEALEDCELENIDHLAQQKGFKQVHHALEFFGLCSHCQ